MENNLKEVYLGDISDVQTGPFGSQLKNEQYIKGGTPVVTVEHIKDFRITDFDYPSITDEDKDRLAKYLMKTDDILFTRVGSVDLSAYVSEKQNGWMFSSRMLRVRTNEEVHSKFLSYYFQQRSFRDYILNISVGATMPSINTSILKSLIISYPPLPEQKAIASVLSSLDDKIDLLHQQNQTLEALAETLFRQWFIERRPELVEGEAKEDWEVLPLSEIAEVKNGKSFKSSDFTDNDFNSYEVVKMGHIERGGGLKLNPKKDFVSREMDVEKWILNKGDIIMAMTDMKDNVVILGVPAMIDKDNHYVLNQRVARIYLKDNSKLISNYLLYIQLNNKDFIAELQTKANSGVQVNLSTEAIKESEILIPPFKLQEEFGHKIIDLYSKIEINREQIQTLTQLRDTLLPKLMSGAVSLSNCGEVRVKM